ncbi:helix-turn-helix transcriptional regulator [Legionella septentrionalis]|uniref:AlpA family phage regulatory protein n=1 Tax=Legionella septentrionalis TaxID=2498109 RepID=A0A433JGY6_9GAMM|nr:AlpA family phage regulatory protein [Legionella septentrionalis]RUQ81526.1 AlpA family phage regulatory protein [Legionella septentrionalis]
MKEDLRRIIRWPGLRKMFDNNISRSTIDRWEKDKRFPARIQIGKNSVAWNLAEVEQWFQEKASIAKGVM